MEKDLPNAGIVPETGSNAAEEAAAGTAEVTLDPAAQLQALAEERDRLAREKEEMNDLLLRRTAEFDNHRKRTERERAELNEYAASGAVKALLPVLDDFERALKQECADEEYAKGIALIYQRMMDTLKKLGLEPMEVVGRPFDPNFHHALEMVETEEADDHSVLEDLVRGYMFKGRLLRAAMVRVAMRG